MNKSGNHAVYLHDYAFAKEYGEVDQISCSYRQNVECKEFIEKEIEENYADNRLDASAVLDAAEKQFGEERVRYVLANTVQKKGAYDTRLQRRNVEWAKAIPVASSVSPDGVDRSPYFVIDAVNTGLVDLVVTAFQARHRKGFEES